MLANPPMRMSSLTPGTSANSPLSTRKVNGKSGISRAANPGMREYEGRSRQWSILADMYLQPMTTREEDGGGLCGGVISILFWRATEDERACLILGYVNPGSTGFDNTDDPRLYRVHKKEDPTIQYSLTPPGFGTLNTAPPLKPVATTHSC